MTLSSCALTVISLLVLLPLRVVAQEPPRPPASPSPSPVATASPSPTPTPEASPTPRDPMSTPTFNGLRMRSIGPAFTSGRVSGFAVDPDESVALLRRGRVGRRVEDDQRRHHLDAGLRQRRLLLDRRDHARPEESAHCLGRHRREQQPAQRLVRRRRLQVGRRRQDLEKRRPQNFRAHRHDRHRPARLEHRLRRRAGAAVGAGRRARPVTRPLTAARPGRTCSTSARTPASPTSSSTREPEHDLLRRISAPPTHVDAHQRRPGKRDLQIDRRRRDLEQDASRLADRRTGPHRSGDLAGRFGRRSTRRSKRPIARAESFARPIAAALGSGATNSIPRAMYYARIVADPKDVDRIYVMNVFLMVSDDGGRTLRTARREEQARRQSRHLDRPGEHRPLSRRLRRRHLRELRPRRELGLQTEPAGAAVLRHRHGQRETFLQRLRRHAGQLQFRWSITNTQCFRHRQFRLVRHKWRRRFSFTGRSGRSEYYLRVTTARRNRSL